ncbi:DNA-binding transcriptional LysR family regulator [Microbacteriaceae bacterium SG_E_30_P1]|uniref:DNA-binding transcriptional LysR family regulator n=1 Tax=Antiquaquibacter oligotrophicus TaxID=2880260 RepID=A0ABT6KLI4_9MICO|nr:LysR family transcriptional regulator substrate-binding protein [Antiquaquibacter oligotrophicus]MDH6180884.1 DNA-binding transcriptional LysR family regulator [Antiquaquibacter oligotrophicus]UDF13409.1 LysR family transcriptional regulator substrate-binding protein [Antiquaquibacter oligotrophicus]
MSGAFVVAFVPGVTPGKWARVWGERMPQHPLTLTPLPQADAVGALVAREADAVFVRMPAPDGFAAIPLYEEQPVVVMAKDHELSILDAVSPNDLTGIHLIDGDWAAAVELAATGVGVAIMPHSVARALSRRDVVARSAIDQPVTRIALVWDEGAASDLTEEFIGIVRGRTANSSRGAAPVKEQEKSKPRPKPAAAARRKSGTPQKRSKRR